MAATNNVNLYKAMDQYFLYKNNIEKKRTLAKNKIHKNMNLTDTEKKNAIASIEENCINCKRNVGTTFSENDRTFKIVCGDVSKPCNLNIEFVVGKKEHYDDVIQSASETVNELKEKIVHLKADLIYGYKEESDIKDEFTQIKDEYNNFQNILESIIRRKNKLTSKTNSQLEPLKQLLNENISIIKKNTKEFLNDNDPVHITNNIRLYNTDIKEILTEIKKNKYATNFVKKDGTEPCEYFYLIQETTRLNDLYVSLFKEDSSKLINFSS
tara:strand:+ start:1443 stop:2249 length:807 start_codon:yes stop_codon:yes gene_type:complete